MIHSESNNQLKVDGILGIEKKRGQCHLSLEYSPGQLSGNNLEVILVKTKGSLSFPYTIQAELNTALRCMCNMMVIY